MTIKQQGGIFGRNPTFNDVEASDVVSENFRVTGTFPAYQIEETDTTDQNWQIRVNGGELLFQKQNDTFSNAVTSMRITQSNNLKVANGAGIDFSATAGTGTSELFDDYEEGTWTPQFSDAGTGGTTTGSGVYVKVGNKVTVHGKIDNIDTTGLTSSNKAYVHGLPFTCTSSTNVLGNVFFSGGVTTSGACFYYIGSSATHGRFFESPYAGTSDILNVSAFTDDAADILINATYIVS